MSRTHVPSAKTFHSSLHMNWVSEECGIVENDEEFSLGWRHVRPGGTEKRENQKRRSRRRSNLSYYLWWESRAKEEWRWWYFSCQGTILVLVDITRDTYPFRFVNDETEWFSLMDVLELPRPVINFLRTMAKEGCRYALSWDIFGGPDALTLTLTWKLTEDQCQSSVVHDMPSQALQATRTPISDDGQLHMKDSVSSPHRSRRQANNCVSAIFRSSRGKSAQPTNLSLDPSNRPLVATLDRSSIRGYQKNHSNTLCAHRDRGDRSNHSSPSTPLNTRNSSEPKNIPRKYLPSRPVMKTHSASVTRARHIATQDDGDDDDDNLLDPWVRRLEHSPSTDRPRTRATSENDASQTNTGLGRVKFKAQPDYFWIGPFFFRLILRKRTHLAVRLWLMLIKTFVLFFISIKKRRGAWCLNFMYHV